MGRAQNIVAFPGSNLIARGDMRPVLGQVMKRHRLPESLGHALVREAANFPQVTPDTALAFALAQRMIQAPIDLEMARGILLVGPSGAGKSAVAAKITHAAALIGRKCELTKADGGLALFRTGTTAPDLLTVMEADGFNPLNVRAASAFSALGDIEGVETIGVVSALSDAEDVSDIVTAFRFRRVIVTNMDRTRRLGAALAACLSGAALAHVTHGPRPEDGLDMLEPGALADQMLEVFSH
jgi:flagellar biosynthesis protein FlhF